MAFLRDLNNPGRYAGAAPTQQQAPSRYEEDSVEEMSTTEEAPPRKPFIPRSINSPTSSFSSLPASPVTGLLIFPEEANQNYNIHSTTNPESTLEKAFDENVKSILGAPISDEDIEVKPDGPLYLPEVRYRRILLSAFGPGGWSLLPRGPHTLLPPNILTREYALFVHGRIVSITRGAALIQGTVNAASGSESVRSNALMRCCKDLGVASELWDPLFVQKWRERFAIRKNVTDRYGNTKYIFAKRTAEQQ